MLKQVLNDLGVKGKLPTDPELVFYLQVDNCGKNKNKTMFSFLTDLVRRGIFSKVKAGFLMVGHTHEDIDQFFSVISKHLKQLHVNCPDLQSFVEEVRKAFSDPKESQMLFFLSLLLFLTMFHSMNHI